jgi:hypothetical protein
MLVPASLRHPIVGERTTDMITQKRTPSLPARPTVPTRTNFSVSYRGLDGRAFDLHADGQRAIGSWISEFETVAPENSVVLAFNFFDELRRVAPVKR